MMFYVYFFLLGSCIGSFINSYSTRMIHHESFYPRSHCDHCNHILYWYELIPIISWFLLKGRCLYCHHPISFRYPCIELLCAFLFTYSYNQFNFSISLLFYLTLISTLLVIALIDLDTYIIKDRLILFILLISLTLSFMESKPLIECILGFFIISLPLTLVALLLQGIGFGDIKLLAVCGLLLGPIKIVLSFIAACLLASIPSLYWIMTKQKTGKDEIPFGPFLVAGIILLIFIDESIIQKLILFL